MNNSYISFASRSLAELRARTMLASFLLWNTTTANTLALVQKERCKSLARWWTKAAINVKYLKLTDEQLIFNVRTLDIPFVVPKTKSIQKASAYCTCLTHFYICRLFFPPKGMKFFWANQMDDFSNGVFLRNPHRGCNSNRFIYLTPHQRRVWSHRWAHTEKCLDHCLTPTYATAWNLLSTFNGRNKPSKEQCAYHAYCVHKNRSHFELLLIKIVFTVRHGSTTAWFGFIKLYGLNVA